ncbi:hypothetical protein [Clostridium sp.]|uniref:hypothetical protein n=1 Tax=Clostridium sp. TaxID=1506 RepID=UPI002630E846|nr:hypothetical protein [uncultured Clostridium sp.]
MNNQVNNKEKNNSNRGHSSTRHILMMVLCCGLPILLIAVLPLLKIWNSAFGVTLISIIPFLCPLIMLLMMLKNSKRNKSCHDNKDKRL